MFKFLFGLIVGFFVCSLSIFFACKYTPNKAKSLAKMVKDKATEYELAKIKDEV